MHQLLTPEIHQGVLLKLFLPWTYNTNTHTSFRHNRTAMQYLKHVRYPDSRRFFSCKCSCHFPFTSEVSNVQVRPVNLKSKARVLQYHSNTPEHNKDAIFKKFNGPKWCCKSFCHIALGMGVNLRDVNTIYHYGAPQSIDDYFQESRRGGGGGTKWGCSLINCVLEGF